MKNGISTDEEKINFTIYRKEFDFTLWVKSEKHNNLMHFVAMAECWGSVFINHNISN